MCLYSLTFSCIIITLAMFWVLICIHPSVSVPYTCHHPAIFLLLPAIYMPHHCPCQYLWRTVAIVRATVICYCCVPICSGHLATHAPLRTTTHHFLLFTPPLAPLLPTPLPLRLLFTRLSYSPNFSSSASRKCDVDIFIVVLRCRMRKRFSRR